MAPRQTLSVSPRFAANQLDFKYGGLVHHSDPCFCPRLQPEHEHQYQVLDLESVKRNYSRSNRNFKISNPGGLGFSHQFPKSLTICQVIITVTDRISRAALTSLLISRIAPPSYWNTRWSELPYWPYFLYLSRTAQQYYASVYQLDDSSQKLRFGDLASSPFLSRHLTRFFPFTVTMLRDSQR